MENACGEINSGEGEIGGKKSPSPFAFSLQGFNHPTNVLMYLHNGMANLTSIVTYLKCICFLS